MEIWGKDPANPTLANDPSFPKQGNHLSMQSLQEWDTEGEREQRGYPSTKPHSQVFGMFCFVFFFFFFFLREGRVLAVIHPRK